MHVTLRQLAVFEAVARHGSFTRAAEALHLSQPAVSMQVKQLEENLGVPLYEQVGKRIFLTQAGREMADYSRRINRLLEEADSVLEDLKGLKRGHLSISVATTANYFATRLLAAFSKQHPGVSFSLDVTNRETLVAQLEHNERDLVIMGRPPAELDLDAVPFMDNPLVLVAPAGHPLAGRKGIPLEEIANERIVMRERGSGTRIAIERWFEERRISFPRGMEMGSNEAIKQAVEAGLGLGIASIHTLELELETGRLRLLDVAGFPIVRHWYIVARRGKRLSPTARAFKDFVLAEAPRFVRLPPEYRQLTGG